MRKPLNRPFPKDWFLRARRYRLFMLREATSIFIAGYLIFMLVWLRRLGQGPEAFEALQASLRSPPAVLLHLLALAGAAWHSITWFNATPKIMNVRKGEEPLPDSLVAIATGYAPWAVVSVIILWGVLA